MWWQGNTAQRPDTMAQGGKAGYVGAKTPPLFALPTPMRSAIIGHRRRSLARKNPTEHTSTDSPRPPPPPEVKPYAGARPSCRLHSERAYLPARATTAGGYDLCAPISFRVPPHGVRWVALECALEIPPAHVVGLILPRSGWLCVLMWKPRRCDRQLLPRRHLCPPAQLWVAGVLRWTWFQGGTACYCAVYFGAVSSS